MLAYLLESALILAIVIIFYKVVLQNTKWYSFNRAYLLIGLLAALLIPRIAFTSYIEAPQMVASTPLNPEINTQDLVPVMQKRPHTHASYVEYLVHQPHPLIRKHNYSYTVLLWAFYSLVSFILLVRFVNNLLQIRKKIRKNTTNKKPSHTEVLLSEQVSPFSFFQYVFLNRNDIENNNIPREIILHEEAHVKQKHSIDILLVEILTIFLWFNPFTFLYKREMKVNHEFLADKSVLQRGINQNKYQNIILDYSLTKVTPQLTNSLNSQPIRRRFKEMNLVTSKRTASFKSFLCLPLILALIFAFSDNELEYPEHEARDTIKVEILNYNYILINQKYITNLKNLNQIVEKLLVDKTSKERNEAITVVEVLDEIQPAYVERVMAELFNLGIKMQKVAIPIKNYKYKGSNMTLFLYEDSDLLIANKRVTIHELKSELESFDEFYVERHQDPMSPENTQLNLIAHIKTSPELIAQAQGILNPYAEVRIKLTAGDKPGWRPLPFKPATENAIISYKKLSTKYKELNKLDTSNIDQEEIEEMVIIYNSLTEEQKKTANKLPKLPD